jgi:uncharacterized membrane protein
MMPTAMADFESLLNRWQSAGVLDEEAADRIRAYESEQTRPAGLRWQRMGWQGVVALTLGAILLACGVALFVSAHWDQLGPGPRFALVIAMVAVFHLAGAFTRKVYRGLSTALHAVGTVSTGAAIALAGQIFNIQEHWPAAVLLWAIAALAGWILLRDQAQETLTFLLFPAWMLSEWMLHAEGYIGNEVYVGRFLFVWAILYLTLFLGSRHKAVQGILFAVAVIAAGFGIVFLLGGWRSWSAEQTFLPLETRFWGWASIAALPLFLSLFRLRKSLVPVVAAIVFSIALPWCIRTWLETYGWGTYTHKVLRFGPNLAAHALVAAFAVFISWWGVRQASRLLVNLGIVGFAVAAGWFYYSDIFDKIGRSLGLIGLGVLFLAGGWALEKTRHGVLARMGKKDNSALEAQ